MKIVFSRKGFDSGSGRGPSPIVDGRPISLPIPDTKNLSRTSYRDLGLGELATKASGGTVNSDTLCHHDPMFLDNGTCVFGQFGGQVTLLENAGVSVGDVFLFFGWFRGEGQPDHHRIFGYLEVEEILRLDGADEANIERFRSIDHPHAIGFHGSDRKDTLYIGKGQTARTASPKLLLTEPGRTRTNWLVPEWLRDVGLSSHHKNWRWPSPGRLKSVYRGQEFVADIEDRAEPKQWLEEIISEIRAS